MLDHLPVDGITIPYQFSMQKIEPELHELAGSKIYCMFDLSHGYLQFPLDNDSHISLSLITPKGIFLQTRTLP